MHHASSPVQETEISDFCVNLFNLEDKQVLHIFKNSESPVNTSVPPFGPLATSLRTLDPWLFFSWVWLFSGASVYPRTQAGTGADGFRAGAAWV